MANDRGPDAGREPILRQLPKMFLSDVQMSAPRGKVAVFGFKDTEERRARGSPGSLCGD